MDEFKFEFDVCKINEFELEFDFSFFKVNEFEFELKTI